jgi:hypothetical protein
MEGFLTTNYSDPTTNRKDGMITFINKKLFKVGDWAFLFDSKYKYFQGKIYQSLAWAI